MKHDAKAYLHDIQDAGGHIREFDNSLGSWPVSRVFAGDR